MVCLCQQCQNVRTKSGRRLGRKQSVIAQQSIAVKIIEAPRAFDWFRHYSIYYTGIDPGPRICEAVEPKGKISVIKTQKPVFQTEEIKLTSIDV